LPQYWALATFFIPIAAAIGYGIWLVVSASGMAQSTRAEVVVRAGALAIMGASFALVPRPWARAVAVSFAAALALTLMAVLQVEVFGAA
jgi:hypothetical protein